MDTIILHKSDNNTKLCGEKYLYIAYILHICFGIPDFFLKKVEPSFQHKSVREKS